MENLSVAVPPQLLYEDPERAILSSNKSVSVKPQSGSSVSSASSSDIISIKLPNTGVAPTSRMYLKYDLAFTSTGTDDADVMLDPFAPDAGFIKRLVLKSSDGTTVNDINNYDTINSLLASVKDTEGFSSSAGSILYNTGVEDEYVTHMVNNGTATSLNAGYKEAAKRGSAKFTNTAGGSVSKTYLHQFRVGLLASHEDHYLPLAFLGSGMTLELHCNDVNNFARVVKAPANDTPIGTALANADCTATYSLSNIEFHLDLVSYDPSIMGSISEKLCQGLKFKSGRVRTQQNAVTASENNIVINDHARSCDSIIVVVRDSSRLGKANNDENSFVASMSSDSSDKIKEYQFSVGSANVPQDRVKFGADSYRHVEQALRPYYGNDFQMGNQVNHANYNLANSDTADRVGRAMIGVNLKSHPQLEDVLSGVSASSGSIPINLALTFESSPASNAQAMVMTFSTQIVEFLADGGCIIHK